MSPQETMPGIVIAYGPGTSPEPAWQAARRLAETRAAAEPAYRPAPVVIPVIVREAARIYAW
jgi:hypothetical protein